MSKLNWVFNWLSLKFYFKLLQACHYLSNLKIITEESTNIIADISIKIENKEMQPLAKWFLNYGTSKSCSWQLETWNSCNNALNLLNIKFRCKKLSSCLSILVKYMSIVLSMLIHGSIPIYLTRFITISILTHRIPNNVWFNLMVSIFSLSLLFGGALLYDDEFKISYLTLKLALLCYWEKCCAISMCVMTMYKISHFMQCSEYHRSSSQDSYFPFETINPMGYDHNIISTFHIQNSQNVSTFIFYHELCHEHFSSIYYCCCC